MQIIAHTSVRLEHLPTGEVSLSICKATGTDTETLAGTMPNAQHAYDIVWQSIVAIAAERRQRAAILVALSSLLLKGTRLVDMLRPDDLEA